ncbi:urease accessory protein UreE [Novosphingobium sp. SG720]|uniref:urease accessory protein UreE n=1 Tax=Novosphingobium sp. SG720 TaxID=2586998 RepID=UPI0014468DAB|nr:urease accessory protein UreE [Novosphingobium sp. SG720]NKJ44432.1 urease accessory protein [Novosphingobium sp. SG720]
MTEPLIARDVLPAGSWDAASAADVIVLDYDARHRRRFRYVAAGGTDFVLDLARATVLAHGDGLALSDGRVVRVEAVPEALMEVRAASPIALLRLAWHIGNRHLPAQIHAGCILLRRDGVILDMLRGLGAQVDLIEAPFTPEGGAYTGEHGHDHGHAPYDHDHAHGHDHDHRHHHSHGHGHHHDHAH